MKKIFVTGIGTDVGKTVVSAILAEALQADYWKPVQTGNYFSKDSDKIKKWISNPKTVIHPEAYSLKQNMSPHAAAEDEGVEIKLSEINLPETDNHLIIEGAGGLLVPLNKDEFVIDLIQKLDVEVVLVMQNYLGSINHALLSVNAMREWKLNVAGFIIAGPQHPLSEDIILRYSKFKCLGRIFKETEINPAVISKYAEVIRPNFL